jgi:hypothetical protein
VDREANWDDYILLQVVVMSLVHNTPRLGFSGFAAWNSAGLVQLLLLHVGPTEWLYYWLHRALHWHPLYQRYHSHHHASFVAEPITGAPPAAGPRIRRAGTPHPQALACGSAPATRLRAPPAPPARPGAAARRGGHPRVGPLARLARIGGAEAAAGFVLAACQKRASPRAPLSARPHASC